MTITIICDCYCHLNHLLIISDSLKFCILFCNRVMVGTSCFVFKSIKVYRTICGIFLSLEHSTFFILQYKFKFICFQGTTDQFLSYFNRCLDWIWCISIVENTIFCIIRYSCYQFSCAIICHSNSCFDHFGVIFHTAKLRIFFGNRVLISTDCCIS